MKIALACDHGGYELKVFAEMAGKGDFEQAGMYARHTLDVMEILDEARKQAGIAFEESVSH